VPVLRLRQLGVMRARHASSHSGQRQYALWTVSRNASLAVGEDERVAQAIGFGRVIGRDLEPMDEGPRRA
jgi:hypothetical protein